MARHCEWCGDVPTGSVVRTTSPSAPDRIICWDCWAARLPDPADVRFAVSGWAQAHGKPASELSSEQRRWEAQYAEDHLDYLEFDRKAIER